jgi:phosphomannomutase
VVDRLESAVRDWLTADPDPDTRAELEALLARGDEAGLAERFAGTLTFGTAGLRAPLGAGPMRMNRLVVRQATAGLVRTLPADATVVIGYDARHKSDVFARDTAGVVTATGRRALLLPRPLPTPVLAFAVRHLGADAGVMVTASHNPPADNGYKVYRSDGAQIVPPIDVEIATAIAEASTSGAAIAVVDGGWELLDDGVVEAYLAGASATLANADGRSGGRLRIVYTPLHGVGRDVAVELLRRAGFEDVHVVAAQGAPDPNFPTVAFPNPEEPGALDLALAEARRVDADVVLANDPDADRLAVCVRDGGEWRRLTGDELGALLADHVLSTTSGDDRLVVTTIVSSPLLGRQAAAAGVDHAETATGFKWIMQAVRERPQDRFVFGYEEALGYAVGDLVHDKDGLTAGLAFARLAASDGDPAARLRAIFERHGWHVTAQVTVPRFGVVDTLLASPPASLAGHAVAEVNDVRWAGAVELVLAGHAGRVVVRPSGTEPKTKAYVQVVAADESDARRRLDVLTSAVRELLLAR